MLNFRQFILVLVKLFFCNSKINGDGIVSKKETACNEAGSFELLQGLVLFSFFLSLGEKEKKEGEREKSNKENNNCEPHDFVFLKNILKF